MTDKPTPPAIRSDAEAAAWSRVVAACAGRTAYADALDLADRTIAELRARIDRGDPRAPGQLRELRRVKATPEELRERAETAGQHGIPTDRHGRPILPGALVYCGRLVRQASEWSWDQWSESPGAFVALFRDPIGAVSAWGYRTAASWEILERGQASDPVPVTYEPERDAQGRPVLR